MKFAVFFTFKPETIAGMMERPADRRAVVSRSAAEAGGTLDTMYYMFGAQDGFVIFDAPDSETAAAVSLAVSSTGAFTHLETHELISPEDMQGILERAKRVRGSYIPPGA